MKIDYKIINVNLTAVVATDTPISDVPCNGCSVCCTKLSPFLTPEEISSGKYPVSFTQPTEYEINTFNAGPKIVLFMNENKGCSMLINGKCMIYNDRPLACRQFDCRKNHHPSIPNMVNNDII